jgi:hypothetical protein
VARRPPSLTFVAILAVIVLVIGGVGAGVLYTVNHPAGPAAPVTVARGDNVTVNYIGFYASGPQLGKVFDTSIKSVAQDNITYPKSLEYTPRNSTGYVPLPVHVGPKAPKNGYSVGGQSYGTVVTGFWEGLIGLGTNQSRMITIPPSLGYGPLNQSCLVTEPLVTTIPAVLTLTPATFAKEYIGVTNSGGVVFTDPTYHWNDRILSSNQTAVVVWRDPTLDQVVNPYGWAIQVSGLTSRTITLTSLLTPDSPGSVLGTISNTTVCKTTRFLVWSVNTLAGTFVENYNAETVGVTLQFLVTIKAIHKPGAS